MSRAEDNDERSGMTTREELIEEAAKAIFGVNNRLDSTQWPRSSYQAVYRERARAALAVFEKAHAPTDDEREALDRAVRGVTWNASNYPHRAQPHILGADIGPLTTKIVEAVESAGFRRSEVPAPQGEPLFHDDDCEADWGPEGQESPCRCAESAQGEPSDAQVYDAEVAFWAHKERTGIFKGAMRAALRAAQGVVGQEGEER